MLSGKLPAPEVCDRLCRACEEFLQAAGEYGTNHLRNEHPLFDFYFGVEAKTMIGYEGNERWNQHARIAAFTRTLYRTGRVILNMVALPQGWRGVDGVRRPWVRDLIHGVQCLRNIVRQLQLDPGLYYWGNGGDTFPRRGEAAEHPRRFRPEVQDLFTNAVAAVTEIHGLAVDRMLGQALRTPARKRRENDPDGLGHTKDEKIMLAISRLQKNPARFAKDIAAEVGLSATMLSRDRLWQRAKQAMLADPPRRGRKRDDGTLEVADTDTDQAAIDRN